MKVFKTKRNIMGYIIIKYTELNKYNELKKSGKLVAWVVNGLIAFYN